MDRFQRQIQLSGFGPEAQKRLTASAVLIVGMGGLGCPVAQYLAAAGIGTLILADGDRVQENNLNRQVLFGYSDIGRNKAESAAEKLRRQYADIKVLALPDFITSSNAIAALRDCDFLVDATDDFGTRYLLNDMAVQLQKPWVFGAIHQFECQVACFNTGSASPTYRDLFPVPPPPGTIPTCEEQGLIGVLAGVTGMFMANEVIARLSGIGSTLGDELLLFDLRSYRTYTAVIPVRKDSRTVAAANSSAPDANSVGEYCRKVPELSWKDATQLAQRAKCVWVDTRSEQERTESPGPPSLHYPAGQLSQNPEHLPGDGLIFLFCSSGARSRAVAAALINYFPGREIYSIEGGLNART